MKRCIEALLILFILVTNVNANISELKQNQPIVLKDTETNIIDNDILELLSEIVSIADESSNVSVYYTDTSSGYYFYYNPDEYYSAVSTLKPIYCQYLLQSGIDLSEKIIFESESNLSSASEKLIKSEKGSSFTVKELIEYTIIYSDNMAYRLLYETYGNSEFNKYIRSLGLEFPRLSTTIEYTGATAKAMAICMKEIYRYSKATGDTFIVDLLKNTTFNQQITQGTEAEVAHKYGYMGGDGGYHDLAIVYTQEPYILSIYTNVDASREGGNDVFVEIAKRVEKLHNKLHSFDENIKIHYISKSTYEELMAQGVTQIIDGCEGECEYHVENIGKVF